MCVFFFFNHPSTTEIYTLSLHDALPIYFRDIAQTAQARAAGQRMNLSIKFHQVRQARGFVGGFAEFLSRFAKARSEEHTSELQSHSDLVCRLLLEKKKKIYRTRSMRDRG